MSLQQCLLVAQLADAAERSVAETRISEIARAFGDLGAARVSVRVVEGMRLLVAVIDLAGERHDLEGVVTWGKESLPDLATAEALLSAPDARLRELPTPLAAVAVNASHGRIVTAAGGVTSLFAASLEGISAWSSHGVAAAWLASGTAEVDPGAVPELVSWEFVGGDRTLLRGVRAVPQATVIDISPSGPSERQFWPFTDRWAPIPAAEAPAIAESALLESLGRDLAAAQAPVLGLTGGADSRTAAVALRELGVPFSTLTYVGDPAASEDAPARRVADALCVDHRVIPIELWGEEEGMRRIEAEALWTGGATPAGFGHVPWPADISHWIAGVGAEVGRSFYYRWAQPAPDEPDRRLLEQVLWAQLGLDLGGATREVREDIKARLRRWIDEAAETGHRGWALLDVIYGEQRVRRWARAMAPRLDAAFVPAFAAAPVLQALASLPLEDRLSDGFARRFIGERMPELVPPAPSRGAGRVPPLHRRRLSLALRDVRRALGVPPLRRGSTAPWHSKPPWSERQAFIDWLRDGVIDSPLIAEAMGEGWQREVRRNFLRGEAHASYLATWAAGPVALQQAIARMQTDAGKQR